MSTRVLLSLFNELRKGDQLGALYPIFARILIYSIIQEHSC